MATLITGGLGYIGSHISKIYPNKDLLILDNLSNSKLNYKKVLPKARVIIDDLNLKTLNKIFKEYKVENVIHMAGFKSVSESVKYPIQYYRNNVNTSLDLLESMEKFKIKKLIFSSSATVYGNNHYCPLKEDLTTNAINTYAETKIIIEKMISDYCKSNKKFSSIILRYFNPIGADKSGDLLDNPLGEPLNLMPILIKSALTGKKLNIFGKDYKTKDGTCIRDYIHVLDLAECHILSIKYLKKFKGCKILNVGMGKGISVLDIIRIFSKANNLKVNYKFVRRRPGDVPISFASNQKIKKLLKWKPRYTYEDMCIDSLRAYLRNN